MNDNERWLWAKLKERGMVEEVLREGVERYLRRRGVAS